MNCWNCGKPGASIPLACCGAPDCGCLAMLSHFDCLPKWRQEEELRWGQRGR